MSSLVDWFLGLRVEDQIPFGVAFVALVGVLTTAISALASASLNAFAVIKTRQIVNKHEEKQWRRDKLWSAYSKAYEKAIESNIFARDTSTTDVFDFVELASKTILQHAPDKVNDQVRAQRQEIISSLIDKRFKLAEKLNKNGNLRITNAEILSDSGSAELLAKTEVLAEGLGLSFSQMLEIMQKLIDCIDSFKLENLPSIQVKYINQLIEELYEFIHFERYPHDAYKEVLTAIGNRMREI